MTNKSTERSNNKDKDHKQEMENVPELRFTGFDDGWITKKLDDIFKFRVAKDMDKERLSEYSNDQFKYPVFGNAIENKGLLGYYDTYEYESNILTVTARGANTGTAYLRDNHFNAIGRLLILLPKKNLNPKFFEEIINNLNIFIESTGVPQLTAPSLKINKVTYPSINEQKKIADFLSSIDKKIELMEKKYQNLLSYAYSLKFELFKGNIISDSELVPLKDLINYSSSNLSLNKLEKNNGSFPLYGADGFVKNIDFYDKDEEYISIVKDGNGVGRLNFNNKKTSVVGTMGYLTSKEENNLRFIYYAITLLNLNKYVIGSTIPHIYFKDFSKEQIYLPKMTIQNKVVDIMLSLDTKIFNLNKEIEFYKEFKSSLLSKMFC